MREIGAVSGQTPPFFTICARPVFREGYLSLCLTREEDKTTREILLNLRSGMFRVRGYNGNTQIPERNHLSLASFACRTEQVFYRFVRSTEATNRNQSPLQTNSCLDLSSGSQELFALGELLETLETVGV